MKTIAVIGAGLAGLASAYHLAKRHNVTLFDAKGIGAGASGIATGLLHPFAGARSKLNWRGWEALGATLSLIREVEPFGDKPIIRHVGMTRFGDRPQFFELSKSEKRVHPLTANELTKKFPICANGPGIYIEDAYAIDTPAYLTALFAASQKRGVSLVIKEIKELKGFDEYVVTAGAWTQSIVELSSLPIKPHKGQLLIMKNPGIDEPINGQVYAVPDKEGHLIVGATFEKDYSSEMPDIQAAKGEILPKAKSMIPTLDEVIECRASLRCSSPNHLPICKKVAPHTTVLTALGSKGLLYHALLALEVDMSL